MSNLSKEAQIEMFGATIESLENAYKSYNDINDILDLTGYVSAILSDAQQEMENGDTELANQFINRAKYFSTLAHRLAR